MQKEKVIPLSQAARMLDIDPYALCYWVRKLEIAKAGSIPFGRTRKMTMLYESSIQEVKEARARSPVIQKRNKPGNENYNL